VSRSATVVGDRRVEIEGATFLRILVADDHGLMLVAVADVLAACEDIDVVASTRQGTEVAALVREYRPDLGLVAAKLADLDGLEVLDQLRESFPEVKVAIHDELDPPAIAQAEERGASGYISKHLDPTELAPALRELLAGRGFACFGTSDWVAPPRPDDLTDSELAILRGVAAGKPNQQIGVDLLVTEQTVRFHLANVYRKLDLHSRIAAARYAYEHGLNDSPFLVRA
jgi:NarL family two-component system response regulator LiaR